MTDHMGRTNIDEGTEGAAFTALRRLLDTGNVWVKLNGIDRVSKQPPHFRDAIEPARELALHFPQRIVWGSDWPHPHARIMPDDGQLIDAIAKIAPENETRQLMLVDNPAKLFRFRAG